MLVNEWLLCFFAYTLEALEAMGKADVEHFWLCVRACQLNYFRDLAVVLVRRSRAKNLWPTEFEWPTVNMNILNRFWQRPLNNEIYNSITRPVGAVSLSTNHLQSIFSAKCSLAMYHDLGHLFNLSRRLDLLSLLLPFALSFLTLSLFILKLWHFFVVVLFFAFAAKVAHVWHATGSTAQL